MKLRINLKGSHRTVVALCSLGFALCALLWGMLWLQTRSEFEAQQRSIGQDLANLSFAVELSAVRIIEDADVALRALRTAFIENGYRHQAADLHREAKRNYEHVTFLGALDARGQLIASNKDWSSVESTNFADRSYFSAHALSDNDSLHISKVLRNRLNGGWRLFLSRRVSNWDGSFAGIVVIGIDPHSLSQNYRGIKLGALSSIAIVGDDGIVQAGTGILSGAIGSGFREGRRTGGQDNPNGTGITHEIFDGQPRTLVYNRIGQHPLHVLVVASGSGYAEFSKDNSRRYQIACGAATAIIVLAVFLAARAHVKYDNRIRAMAFTDSLTGLANRARFRERLDAVLERRDQNFTVFLLDLDGFKGVNDRLGHAVGDQVLVEVAQRMKRATREGDLLVRLGGDEFAILCCPSDPSAELEIGKRLCRAVSAPFTVEGRVLNLGVSVGIATAFGAWSIPDILRQADVALYAAKAGGRGTVRRYDEAMERAAA
jgi:diguanylate cyclase (GGDEF)-like protein